MQTSENVFTSTNSFRCMLQYILMQPRRQRRPCDIAGVERVASLGDYIVLVLGGDLFHSGSLQRVGCIVGMFFGPNIGNTPQEII